MYPGTMNTLLRSGSNIQNKFEFINTIQERFKDIQMLVGVGVEGGDIVDRDRGAVGSVPLSQSNGNLVN